MRIIIASPSYWPSQDGATIITSYLAEGLAARGHEVMVLTSAGNGGLQELPHREIHGGVDIARMRIYVQWPLVIKGRDKESTKQAYLHYIEQNKPDALIVVCSQTWTLDWLLSDLKKITCAKIFYSHGYSAWKEKCPFGEQIKRRNILGVWSLLKNKWYYDKLYQKIAMFDRAIYLSEDNNSALYAQKYGLTNGRVLKNAIDDCFFEPQMQHTYENKKTLRFLFVANYNDNKNQKMLIQAFAKADIGNSQLILVGFEENTYSDMLKRCAKETLQGQHQKEVVFKTHISREQVIDQYRICDVFTCASRSETYSIVAHEAGATGMPIISTNVGIYSKITGVYLVNDEEQMKEAMECLYKYPEERKRRGGQIKGWLDKQKCRIKDKIDWLENDMQNIVKEKQLTI